ncbi:SH2 domain-containing protein 6 [Folsomia candida]|uniref:SH2 domain-containing protein 6 n=1 Tax=Folsomia candida TaxID=158441 RepID=UPI000B909BBE|nr:SH2 domain-containing protein 6 [Folsomia candida]
MSDGLSDDVSDWGSDFDDDVDEETVRHQHSEIYEIPDGKPTRPVPTVVPEWLNKVADENDKPSAAEYIENVLLPTRATKDEESKNFIETLKRKLSQKNLLAAVKNSDNKTSNHNNNVTKNSIVAGNNNFNSISPPENVKRAVELGPQINQIKDALQKYPWFYRVDRSRAELILENYTTDGAFLVRECHHGGGPMVPFTLTIRFNGRLFHIQIRLRSDSRFALGTLKLNEMHFESVAEMIDTYKKTHLQLHSNGKFFGETKLTQPPIVYSYSNKC